MGSVSPITCGAAYQPGNVEPAPVPAVDSLRAGGGAAVLGPSSPGRLGGAPAVTDVYSSVTELLQSIGGGVEDDRLLRLLITLMILLALFENQHNQLAESNDPLRALGADSDVRTPTIGVYTSSTTISIQQSQMVVMTDSVAANGDNHQESGGALDVLA